jgi:hypothetical protein
VRTLFEIIDGAKDGNKPEYDECYYAMLAYSYLFQSSLDHLYKLVEKGDKVTPVIVNRYAEEDHKMFQAALKTQPDKWIGENNDPNKAEYQAMRKIGKRIINDVIKRANGKE